MRLKYNQLVSWAAAINEGGEEKSIKAAPSFSGHLAEQSAKTTIRWPTRTIITEGMQLLSFVSPTLLLPKPG